MRAHGFNGPSQTFYQKVPSQRNTPPLTFVLRLRAGDDPPDQAAPHQGLSGETRLLPFPRILQPAGSRIHTVGVSQQAVHHLSIGLERERRACWLDQGVCVCVCLHN